MDQVHVQNGRVKLFSRNCHDYTNKYQYGDAFKEIAPSIKATGVCPSVSV